EGDESDGTLGIYRPEYAILLNVEEEHLDFYSDLAAIERVISKFLDQVSGSVIFCADDANTARLCSGRVNAVSYGATERALYQYGNVKEAQTGSRFEVWKSGLPLGKILLGVPGRHNVSNALGVVALATELGVPFFKIARALESFRGAKRRF